MCARQSLGEEDERRTETSRTNLAVDRPLPGKGGHTRNRVLRGVRATGAAKRTQGVQLPRDPASKANRRGSVRRIMRRAQHLHAVRPERAGPTGVKERS